MAKWRVSGAEHDYGHVIAKHLFISSVPLVCDFVQRVLKNEQSCDCLVVEC